ncbi:hypothetical protein AYI70_g8525 [Smittium culicis]|uniref:Uncharacterized protein n=1 Tax=Smittium culicis TaxID=133412 RepID=A0A1R1XFM7_9FUNG|nr:hypothetical protein AYI70_g8525 [Smittium culicis]
MFPVSGPTIRSITEPVGLYQDSPPGFTIAQVPRNANLSILERTKNHGKTLRGVCENHTQHILQASGAWIKDQQREIVYIPMPIYHTSVDSNKLTEYDTEGFNKQDLGSPTRRQQITQR